MRASKHGDAHLDPEKLKAAVRRLDEQLSQVKENANRLKERDCKFVELESVLEGLPEKVSHPVMVPFGPLAFFEGHLEHTNEVLVQLSSEWFALKTAKSALGTVGRRRQRLRSELDNVGKELEELQARKRLARNEAAAAGIGSFSDDGFLDIREPLADVEEDTERAKMGGVHGATVTRDADGYLDIREPLDEDTERFATSGVRGATISRDADGYLDIREPLSDDEPPNPQQVAPGSLPPREDQSSCDGWNFDRLLELERLDEADTDGVDRHLGGGDLASSKPSGNPWNLDRLAELEKDELDELKELDNLIESYERTGGPPNSISNGSADPLKAVAGLDSFSEVRAQTPADLYKLMSGADACIGSASSSAEASPELSKDRVAPSLRMVSEQAFSGEVRESANPASLLGRDTHGTLGMNAETSAIGPQRVSKFKADRQRPNR